MLNWLAGQRPADIGSAHRDHDDAPDTPAPVFAVRAFKHAIFGTPATVQTKQRRNSAIERDNARPSFTRASRPVMTRPKSASDAATLTAFDALPPSPTKGILLTPGTTTSGRGKSVKFGGIPAEQPVKEEDGGVAESPRRGGRSRARADSATADYFPPMDKTVDRSKPDGANQQAGETICGQNCSTDDPAREPRCSTGRYWKHEYDIYRENTASEVRKLITKQRAAKSFAREKDDQCSALTEELRQERIKVQDLERRAAELEEQVKSLKDEMARTSSRPERSFEDHPLPTTARPSMELQSHSTEQHKQDMSRLEQSSIVSEIRARRTDRRSFKTGVEQSLQAPLAESDTKGASTVLTSLESNILSDDRPTERLSRASVVARQRQDEFREKRNTTRLASTSPTRRPDAVTYQIKPLAFATEKVNISTFEPSYACSKVETKENVLPSQTLASTSQDNHGKQIFSRDGDEIPPDRIAAARARLAVRRQSRPNNGVRAADSR